MTMTRSGSSSSESEEDIADDLVYEGVIQTVEGSDHFEALASVCGGDYKAEELVRLRRIETSADGGRFDADSIFFTDDFPLAEGVLGVRYLQVGERAASPERPDVPSASDQAFARRDDEGGG